MFISTLSHSSFPDTSISFDTNLFHPVEYMTLAIFFCWAWYPLMSHKSRSSFVIAVLATGTLFGMADEIHQAFVPGRDSSLVDLVLDFVGLCIGVGLFMAARHAHDLLKPQCDGSR